MLHLIYAVLLACSAPQSGSTVGPQWFAGDVHMHVAPPDDPADVEMSATEIAEAARAAHMDFVVLTPHLWPGRWNSAFRRQWQQFAREVRTENRITLIPGIEWTTRAGHFTVAGVEIDQLGDDLLASAHAAGAFVSVNHPFATSLPIVTPHRLPAVLRAPAKPGLAISHYDISYRAWSAQAPGFTAIDGVEVWNVPLSLENIVVRPGGLTGEQRAWLEANRVVHAEHRRLTAVGGTDNHHRGILATTWVLADDATEGAILAGLRAGRTCVGSAEGGTFRARGDDGRWARIGDSVTASGAIQLAWDGTARLFVDGVDAGEHTGGFSHAAHGKLHTYRIELGASRCGFIYSNL